jgi:hypothetical protein
MIAVRFTVAGMAKKSGNPAEKIPRGLVEENLHGVPVRGKHALSPCDVIIAVIIEALECFQKGGRVPLLDGIVSLPENSNKISFFGCLMEKVKIFGASSMVVGRFAYSFLHHPSILGLYNSGQT